MIYFLRFGAFSTKSHILNKLLFSPERMKNRKESDEQLKIYNFYNLLPKSPCIAG